MKTPSWSVLFVAAFLLCACGRSPSDADQRNSALVTPPMEIPTPTTIVAAEAPTPLAPTETHLPTLSPLPLEATLSALLSPYLAISATVPASVATLVNTAILNDMATSQANQFSTATAWAALPINVGTPTVPAPRPDGLDLAEPSSWQRYIDATGFSFDHLVSQNIIVVGPSSLPKSVGGSGVVARFENGEIVRGANEGISFSVFRGENPLITDMAFPANMESPQGKPHFEVKLDFPGATHAWMYLFGDQNTSPNPSNLDYWTYGPQLYVHLYNKDCKADIQFSGAVDPPGPIEDLLAKPLDQVVAEHFPVLDHMYRSVEFPPECGEAEEETWQSPSPLTTPSPESLMAEPESLWAMYSDPTGVSFEYPAETTARRVQPSEYDVETANWMSFAYQGAPNEDQPVPPYPFRVSTYRGKDVINEALEPFELTYGNREPEHMLEEFTSDSGDRVEMFLWQQLGEDTGVPGYWPFCCQSLGVRVTSELCDVQARFSFILSDTHSLEQLKDLGMEQFVQQNVPVLDHMYRSVQFPPECN